MRAKIDIPAYFQDERIPVDTTLVGWAALVQELSIIAFGFVYIYPLEVGNGRMHRCLIRHVLAERQFSPPDMVFPVSNVML